MYSDHFPILLVDGRVRGGRRPFRFENMWLKENGFLDKIKEWWEFFEFLGSLSFVLDSKLKALKNKLKVWNQGSFGDISFRKSSLLNELASLDFLDERELLDERGKARKLEVLGDLDHLIELEQNSWR